MIDPVAMSSSSDNTGSQAISQGQEGTLGKLPAELLSEIFKQLPVGDIKSLRLVNEFYRCRSSEYLMERIFLAARPQTIAVFNKIIDHPYLGKNITEIVYDVSFFADGTHENPRMKSDGEYEGTSGEETDTELFNSFERGSVHEVDAHRRWLESEPESQKRTLALDNYRTLMAEQQQIIGRGDDLRCLERAAQLLPKLRSIIYTDWDNMSLISGQWYREEGPMAWDLVADACRPFCNDAHLVTPAAIVTRSLSSVLSLVLKGDATISNLHISVGARPEKQILSVLHAVEQARKSISMDKPSTWTKLMPNLTTLELFFGANRADKKKGLFKPIKIYARLLTQAKQLCTLRLSTTNSIWMLGGPWVFSTPMEDIRRFIFGQISLPSLQTLGLDGGFYAYSDELVGFLGLHASTLKHLLLDKTCLKEHRQAWPSVFDRLRASLTNLETIHLNFLYTLSDDNRSPYGWSKRCPKQRALLDNACRWILGNGEPTEADREGFEYVQCYWHSLARERNDMPNLHSFCG